MVTLKCSTGNFSSGKSDETFSRWRILLPDESFTLRSFPQLGIRKFWLFRMRYIIDKGWLFDYWHIWLLFYPTAYMNLFIYYLFAYAISFYQLNYCFLMSSENAVSIEDIKYCIKCQTSYCIIRLYLQP